MLSKYKRFCLHLWDPLQPTDVSEICVHGQRWQSSSISSFVTQGGWISFRWGTEIFSTSPRCLSHFSKPLFLVSWGICVTQTGWSPGLCNGHACAKEEPPLFKTPVHSRYRGKVNGHRFHLSPLRKGGTHQYWLISCHLPLRHRLK